MSEQIGERIRRVRRLQRLTLQDVATLVGVTRSLLSKIETGKSSPPLATLVRIAAALGVKAAEFLNTEEGGSAAVFLPAAKTAGASLRGTDKGYRFAGLAAGRGKPLMQAFVFEAKQGKVERRPLSHAGEELVYMLEGEMSYTVGAATYHLRLGDSLYFDSEEDHDLVPLTPSVRYLAVFVER
jgi:transcriptional regulator with XRE-family HTH domain